MQMRLLGSIAGLMFFVVAPVSAQKYPEKVIIIVVPFTAGGPTDTVARLVAQPMTKMLKQQFIVENVGGAGGTIGATASRKRRRTVILCCCITSATPQRRRCIVNCLTTRSMILSPSAWSTNADDVDRPAPKFRSRMSRSSSPI